MINVGHNKRLLCLGVVISYANHVKGLSCLVFVCLGPVMVPIFFLSKLITISIYEIKNTNQFKNLIFLYQEKITKKTIEEFCGGRRNNAHVLPLTIRTRGEGVGGIIGMTCCCV